MPDASLSFPPFRLDLAALRKAGLKLTQVRKGSWYDEVSTLPCVSLDIPFLRGYVFHGARGTRRPTLHFRFPHHVTRITFSHPNR
jgi:hypothetical protein